MCSIACLPAHKLYAFLDINATLGLTPDPQPPPAEPPETIMQVGGAVTECVQGMACLLSDWDMGGGGLDGLAMIRPACLQYDWAAL